MMTPNEAEQFSRCMKEARIICDLPQIAELHDLAKYCVEKEMDVLRRTEVVQSDGELNLKDLPCHQGDKVEVILLIPDWRREKERAAAWQRFVDRATSTRFYSTQPYPKRDELYDRP